MPALTALTVAATAIAASLPTVTQLRWERRVLLVSAPAAADPDAAAQRRIFAEIGQSGDDRDLMLVEVIGDTVRGSSDPAATLRRTYKLPDRRFAVVLIGKDGDVKQRSATPVTAASLTATIDAMPMRRNGER